LNPAEAQIPWAQGRREKMKDKGIGFSQLGVLSILCFSSELGRKELL